MLVQVKYFKSYNSENFFSTILSRLCNSLLTCKYLIFFSSVLFPSFLSFTCQTTDDIVSSAECSSDDEDFIDCEPSTGKSGQSCFACFLISFAKNNAYIYLYVCECIHI